MNRVFRKYKLFPRLLDEEKLDDQAGKHSVNAEKTDPDSQVKFEVGCGEFSVGLSSSYCFGTGAEKRPALNQPLSASALITIVSIGGTT